MAHGSVKASLTRGVARSANLFFCLLVVFVGWAPAPAEGQQTVCTTLASGLNYTTGSYTWDTKLGAPFVISQVPMQFTGFRALIFWDTITTWNLLSATICQYQASTMSSPIVSFNPAATLCTAVAGQANGTYICQFAAAAGTLNITTPGSYVLVLELASTASVSWLLGVGGVPVNTPDTLSISSGWWDLPATGGAWAFVNSSTFVYSLDGCAQVVPSPSSVSSPSPSRSPSSSPSPSPSPSLSSSPSPSPTSSSSPYPSLIPPPSPSSNSVPSVSSTPAPSPSPLPSASPSSFPVEVINNQTTVATQIQTTFADAQPNVTITTSVKENNNASRSSQVTLGFAAIEEVPAPGSGATPLLYDLQQLGWTVAGDDVLSLLPPHWGQANNNNNASNATSATTEFFATQVGLRNGSHNATLVYAFSSFNSSTTEQPAFTGAFVKFSLAIIGWQWSDSGATLRVTIDLAPAIATAAQLPGSGQDDVFAMRSADASQPGILMRVQTSANATSGSETTLVQVQATVDASVASALVLDVAHFNGTLTYDPDVALLLGGQGGQGGGGSTTWIIAVAVAVPVAVGFVLLVITAALVLGWYRRRRRNSDARMRRAISFGGDDDHDHEEGL